MSNPMERALELAQASAGLASPNPTVSAVLVKDGEVLAEGTTEPGGLHAEAIALRKAGPAARGSTLYVTLEPCCHYGKTPPCTDAVIRAGVASVHMAMLDPNPLVAGHGSELLTSAGISTSVGTGKDIATVLYEAHAKYIMTGTPFITAKYAMSLDGKIATRSGSSQWITGSEARRYVHTLRGMNDAVVVGIGTAIADDPSLTARTEGGDLQSTQPLRVIIDTNGRLPVHSKVLDQPGRTLIACSSITEDKKLQLEQRGAEVLQLSSREGGVDLVELMQALGSREVTSALVEGGAMILGTLFDQGLVDKVVAFVSPKIIGGKDSLTPVAGIGVDLVDEAITIDGADMKQVGPDMVITGYPGGRRV